MARQAKTLKELAQVRADNRDELNHYVGNQGTALGRKNFDVNDNPSGDPCIIVYMPHKIHEKLLSKKQTIPKTLKTADGKLEAPTDVVVTTIPNTGKKQPPLSEANQKLTQKLQWLDGSLDHIPVGAQVGFGEVVDRLVGNVVKPSLGRYVGTIGYMVRSQENPDLIGFLTNQHVGVRPGHSLYIPGFDSKALRVGITRNVREITPDEEWLPGVDEAFAFVRTDCAFVEAEKRLASLLHNTIPSVGDIGTPYEINLDSMYIIGKPVKKVGRTTGLQMGTIVAFGYGIAGESQMLDHFAGKEPANLYTDIMIAPRSPDKVFSAGGDSGSLILLDTDDEDKNMPIALLWGGQPSDIGRSYGLENLTYGINLKRILDTLKLERL
jgi:hypothetical protein